MHQSLQINRRSVFCASMNTSWEGRVRYPNTSRTGETLKRMVRGSIAGEKTAEREKSARRLAVVHRFSALLLFGILGLIEIVNVSW